MIRIITGDPGAGKSLRGVEYLREALTTGRPVYQFGINGLVPELGVLDCNPRDWESLPDGSIVVIDEAQDVWPTRSGATVPPDIRALSKHRHRGFDFVLLTQRPTFLDVYVRDLAGEHEHVFRQFGTGMAKIIRWPGVEEKPRAPMTMSRGSEFYWKYDKSLYGLYKSSTLHTVKSKVPMKLKLIPVALVGIAVLAWYAWGSLMGLSNRDAAVVEQSEPVSGSASLAAAIAPDGVTLANLSPEQFILARIPRIASDPGSAPIFDGREVLAKPELYCVSTEEGRCMCHTEQATRYQISRMECLSIVRNGFYNPYRMPMVSATTEPVSESSLPANKASEPRPAVVPRARIDAAAKPSPSLEGFDLGS